MKKICFIGHRNIWKDNVKAQLKKVVSQEIKNGCKNFLIGTHGDFDKMALNVCGQFQKEYRNIKIEVVVNSLSKSKTNFCFDKNQEKHFEIIMFDVEEKYFKNKIIASNKKMVDECDGLICYVDTNCLANLSGAKKIYNYAKRKQLKIINLFQNN